MRITGFIEKQTPFTYQKEGKIYRKKHLLVRYPFYNQFEKIWLTVNDQLEIPANWSKQYVFTFDAVTKFSHPKIFTDFYLHAISNAIEIDTNSFFVICDTDFCKDEFQVLNSEDVKGRIKKTVVLKNKSQHVLHVYYWEDNFFLQNLEESNKVQLHCRSLPYKDKWINNIEIWRTQTNENFIGTIL